MAVTRRPVESAERQLVTISFAGFNRAWAAWIGDRLERHGHDVTYQRWDLTPESTIEEVLSDLMLAEGRILVVLSNWYFQLGPRKHEEWNRALRSVVAQNADRFAAVSVDAGGPLPSAATVFRAAELWGIGAAEAERRLLKRLDIQAAVSGNGPTDRTGPRFPDDEPAVWGGVPRRNVRFTGRENLLGDIYHQLQNAGRGAAVCTLYGMSGVGKTQIAAEYVYRFGSEYDAVWWVPAGQRGTLRQRLAELAPALGLTTGPEYGERLRAVRDSLRRGEPYSRWLLVLDGADEPDLVADLLPTGQGHVLITSQNREWSEHNTAMIGIPVYDRKESVAFVRRRAGRLDEAEADRLAEALEDLPLLLDQTAGWLSDSTMSVDEYVELLESGSDTEIGLKVAADFPMTFQMAWSILLNRLRETVPESVDLLRLCVFFAPGPIPVGLLREIPHWDVPEQLKSLMNDPLRWAAAINKLVQYSVVQQEAHQGVGDESSAGTEILHMHRMVHQTVRDGITESDREEFSRVVQSALAAANPGRPDNPHNWPRYAELAPHLKAANVLESDDAAIQTLVLDCLRYMYASGEYAAGLKLAERALTAWKQSLGDTHPRIWTLIHHQANLLRETGKYEEAARIERTAVEHLRAERGAQDLDTLRAGAGLAASLRALAQYDEALELSQTVLNGFRGLFGEQDTRTLRALNNLAVSLPLLGRYDEALELQRQLLSTLREVLGARNTITSYAEVNYAWTLRLLGRYAEALSVQERSAGALRSLLGRNHLSTLRAEQNLAMCRYRSGDRLEAQAALAEALERMDRVLGEEHPTTLLTAAVYTCVQREHGDLDRARAVGERVLDAYRRSLGSRHPYTIGAKSNHALVLRGAGERQQAQVLVEEALVDMSTAVGPDHPWTLGTALNVTASRNLAGDAEGAAELSADTVRRSAESLGAEHPLTLSCRVALASDLRALRKHREAEKVEEEALAALAATLGGQHVHTVSARSRTRPFWDFEPLLT
jgi:tetratricopeptide (TPR) repeat protein